MAFQPTAPTLPDVGAATFDPNQAIDNAYSPFPVGRLLSYVSTEAGSDEIEERGDVFVTAATRMIQGVKATIVRDTVYDAEGRPLEDTLDWYAQDTDGNVWYLGENSYSFEYDEDTGAFLGYSPDGSWEWGVDGALPGLTRPAVSAVGDSYYQEFYPGEAEDAAQVLATDAQLSLDIGDFAEVIKTFDFSTSESTAREFKYAAPGVGFIREEGLDADDQIEDVTDLVGVRTVRPSAGEADDVPLADLDEGVAITPDEPEREDFEETDDDDEGDETEDFTVTYLGGVDDLDNAVGVYEYDQRTGEIGEARILFASSDTTRTGASKTVEVSAGAGLGVFLVANAAGSGIDIEAFREGGLFFRNFATDAPATLHDGLAPLASDADGNLLPLTVFHTLDGAADGMNLLNPGGAVQATELEAGPDDDRNCGDDEDEVVLLGFEERMPTDPEADGDHNDVVLAVSDDRLSEAAVKELAAMFGSEVFAPGGASGDRLVGGAFDDLLIGGGGDDSLHGRAGDDRLRGDVGDDLLRGGRGDDRLSGGFGDDLIDGGRGDDVARFRGDASGYDVRTLADGSIRVIDIDTADGDFGTDLLRSVEALRFADDLLLV